MKEGKKIIKAVRYGKGFDHPLIGGMVMAEGVDGGGPCEDVEIKVGKFWMIVELVLEEDQQFSRCEGGRKMRFDELVELTGRGVGKRQSGDGSGRNSSWACNWRSEL